MPEADTLPASDDVKPDVAAAAAAAAPDVKPDGKADAADAKSILGDAADGKVSDDGKVPVVAPATWPDQWRDLLAGDDKNDLKTLKTLSDPTMVWKQNKALRAKMASGNKPDPFPDKGTDEEKAAWRKEQNVPDAVEGYKLDLPKGIVVGEADKPGMERLAAFAHTNHWTSAQYNQVAQAYYAELDAQTAARDEADAQYREEAQTTLRADWGPADYRTNLNAMGNLLNGAPKDVKDSIMASRAPDGRMLGDNPNVLKWLAQVGLDLNPAATLMPAGGANAKGIDAELEEIRKLNREDPDKYDADKKLQAREIELRDAQLKLQKRGRAA